MNRLLFTIAILLLTVVACESNDSPTLEITDPPLSAEDIISMASERLETLNSFHFDLDQNGEGTRIAKGLEMTASYGDVSRPQRMWIKVFAGFVNVEIITVGDSTYMTNPLNGDWEPLPTSFSAVRFFDPDIGLTAIVSGITDATKIKKEEKDGVLCYRIRGMLDSSKLSAISCGYAIEGVSIDTDIWIGRDDFLIREVRLDGQVTEYEKEGIVRTLSISNHDEPVSIELPE